MCYSFGDARALGLCVNHEDQISGQHVDATGKEKTRTQSCSPPAPPLLLEEDPRRWRGTRGAPKLASASGLAPVEQGTGFAARTAAPTVTPTPPSHPQPCHCQRQRPQTLGIEPRSVPSPAYRAIKKHAVRKRACGGRSHDLTWWIFRFI